MFIEYSRYVAAEIQELNIELFGKADLRFIEAMYKVSYVCVIFKVITC